MLSQSRWTKAGIEILLVSILLGSTPIVVLAQQPWEREPFSATASEIQRAAAEVPLEDGADVVVLFESVRYAFGAHKRKTYTYRLVFRVDTPRGAENWATFQIGWKPWYQERPDIRARVISPSGVEHTLDPQTIGEFPARQSQPDILSDARVLQAPLPAVEPGAVVEEEVQIRDTSPFFEAGVTGFFYFGNEAGPTLKSELVIEAPTSLPLKYVKRLLPSVEPSRIEEDGRLQVTFTVDRLEALEPYDPFVPSDVPQRPHISLSTGESWAAMARGYSQVVDSQVEVGTVKHKAEEAVGEAKGPKAIVERLLTWLHQQVRYTGIEFGEAVIVPRTPTETLQRRYGDCKDKATLLVAMLRALGIDAHVALVFVGITDVEPETPGLGAFNHAIVYVPGDPDLWVDATAEFARVGQLPVSVQGRLALVAAPGTTSLLRTPSASPHDNRVVERREFFLSEHGKARAVETSEYWGAAEMEMRASYSQASSEEVKEGLMQYAKDIYVAEDVNSIDFTDPYDISQPFRLRFEATGVERAWTENADAGVAIFPVNLLDRLPQPFWPTAEEGKEDESEDTKDISAGLVKKDVLVFHEPIMTEWQYRIVPPPGFIPRSLPSDTEEQLGPIRMSRTFSVEDGGTVSATFRAEAVESRFASEQADALRGGIEELQEAPPVFVQFEHKGEAHVELGQVREALEEFRKLSALHPDEALHHTQVARALLAGGLGEAARTEARRAIDLEPESALAQSTLGWILQHDLVGRRFRKGFDHEGAVTAYARAVELEPTNIINQADLAILLEHNAEGVRYGEGADMDRAIEIYQQFLEDLPPENPLHNNLLVAWERTGQFDELIEFVQGRQRQAGPDTHLLVALAASDGAQPALREAARRFTEISSRQQALAQAGNLLMRLRYYSEAADLLRAGAQGTPNATSVLQVAELFRRTRRYEEVSLADDDPRNTVRKFFVALFLGDAEDILELLVSAARDLSEEEISQLGGVQRSLREMAEREGITPEFIVDVALSAPQFSVEGDDALGYRIRMQAPGPTGTQTLVSYVIREEGEYRLLSFGGHFGFAGLEILHRAKANDLAGARQLLDWIREERPLPGGDDPLRGSPFVRYWSKGQDGNGDAIRYAAASLMAETAAYAEQAIPILEEGRSRTPEEEQIRFDQALVIAYGQDKQYEEQLVAGRRLLEAHPKSEAAFGTVVAALGQLRKWEAVKELAEARLELLPDDAVALRALAGQAQEATNYQEARELYGGLIASGRATVTDYNHLSWLSLFDGGASEESLQTAQQGVRISNENNAPILHTLACIYAEQGRTAEARDVIWKAMDVWDLEEPNLQIWYVFGRLAEHYGDTEAAISAYQKVKPPEGEEDEADRPHTTIQLARKRLALLEKHPQVAGSLKNLAELYQAQGRFDEAESLFKRALAIAEKDLGPEHPNVAASLDNLAELYRSLAQHGKAEPLHKRALAIWEEALGPYHQTVVRARENYALLLREMGRNTEAEKLEAHAQALGALRLKADQEGLLFLSEKVLEGKLVERVQPTYPDLAKQARVQGAVQLEATISRTGAVQTLQVLEGHPLLAQAALDAVRQWRYEPTFVNDQPVEVVTIINVVFQLTE